ncbi:thiol:disulfide interchange protein [Sphingomonas sp. Leaf17]|uniref:protein-disulfide reductase DsbD family protein n=1 Tax=Sphingomonas sp. Leaf17 TaxID=1735683 RepID=UPI0006F4E2F3|nr:protein-disulfide reductase DsbD domain-containing protein [Sphingomonas sp. Leaf17]KQM67502.1 thiol:disulfide interchange protein [Sphingomonas sp. Leaf17]
MRAFGFGIVTLVLALLLGTPAGAQHLRMRMVAESAVPRSGQEVTIALATVPEKGWHGYWRNPGDAGFAPSYAWTLPSGASMSDPEWPVPTTLIVAGLMNYVYEAPYAPLVRFRVPAGLAVGTPLPVRLKTSYLVCTDTVCVPESQELALTLRVGDGAISPAQTTAFGDWRRAIPRVLDARAAYAAQADGGVRIAIPYPATASLENAYFFPIGVDAIEAAAPQTITRAGDRVIVATKVKPTHAAGGPIDGVLRIGDGTGLAVMAAPGAVPAAGEESAGGAGAVWTTALLAFAGAVLGGLILNVMPCVFPILSLKALALAKGNTDARTARGDALAYAAGVILVCLAMGGIILALRAGGSAVGWAFQLQDPRAILVLMLLSVVIALNLAGLFEVPMPRFAGHAGAAGSFATGALAAFVATPCSGPFMGAALGAALVLPWPAALAIFGGLGLGLALPFLLLGFVPALRRRLPKPGAWMATLRHILSVPMWLTALALGWVLGRQAGVDGLTIGLGVTLVGALALWAGGRRQARGLGLGWIAPAVLVVAAVGGAAIVTRAPAAAAQTVAGAGMEAEPFSESRLATLRAQKRPVFAYFTADWCLTCKVNEKTAIETEGTRAAFAANNVAVLVGDWTDGDPVLGRFIAAHNRAGVPLYLYYAPGTAEPRVLPQVLTTSFLEQLAQ